MTFFLIIEPCLRHFLEGKTGRPEKLRYHNKMCSFTEWGGGRGGPCLCHQMTQGRSKKFQVLFEWPVACSINKTMKL